MKQLTVIFALLVGCQAVSFFNLVAQEWDAFKLEHKKAYPNDIEEKFRMKIFMENKRKIAKHNSNYEKGLVNYKLALNQFGDLLSHEFRGLVNGFNRTKNGGHLKRRLLKGSTFIHPAHVELPASVDWREHGAVTPVKDQGHCGSCWSFSATGALEGQHFRKTGKLISLSEQNLIDCSTKYGNNGCNGGLMDQAFQYVKDNGGIDTEKSYPYEAEDDKCRYLAEDSGATDSGFVDVPEGSEKDLKAAIATVGPVSVAIDASHESFQFYSEGVYDDHECSSTELDHGVLAVGYGSEVDPDDPDAEKKNYWLIKNSWGTKWGLDGYVKIARDKRNLCGVATQASYPLV
ncbi:procathepsin L [Ischnura elegans]|uniref:procathepsin L n=1 Tax=Ischnura elegans TaxID=197161 RepID=UPI001ED8ACA0|nr:procathepsin L [Ischnura elegans]